jgi:hypothetical protein
VFGGLATTSWIKTVWLFASRFKIEVRDSEAKLADRRTNDQFLMVEFGRAGFRGPESLKLNICRMFLHSVTLSDIGTVNGKSMSLSAWQGQDDASCGAECEWPRVQTKLPKLGSLAQGAPVVFSKPWFIENPSRVHGSLASVP